MLGERCLFAALECDEVGGITKLVFMMAGITEVPYPYRTSPWDRVERIAERCGISEDKVQKELARLYKLKLLPFTEPDEYEQMYNRPPSPSEKKKPPLSMTIQVAVFRKTEDSCWYCGGVLEQSNRTIDHIIPIADGGSDDATNLVPACKTCNSGKGKRSVEYLRGRFEKKSRGVEISEEQIAYLKTQGIDVPPLPRYEFYFEKMGLKP